MNNLINQNKLIKSLDEGTLSERRFNIYFICYLFTFTLSIAISSKDTNHDKVIGIIEFIVATFCLIGSYVINGDKNFMQRYIAINLSNMITLIIPLILVYAFFFDINDNYNRIISVISGIIYLGLVLFNFYKLKRTEKLNY